MVTAFKPYFLNVGLLPCSAGGLIFQACAWPLEPCFPPLHPPNATPFVLIIREAAGCCVILGRLSHFVFPLAVDSVGSAFHRVFVCLQAIFSSAQILFLALCSEIIPSDVQWPLHNATD